MERKLIITDAHPQSLSKKELTIELTGGSPWFGYVWLNGTPYTVVEGARTFKITKTKM